MNFQNNKIIDELICRLRKKQIIPFIGAGMSRKFDIPGWNALVERVANIIGISSQKIKEKRDLLVAIEYLVIKGYDRINDILKDIVLKSENSKLVSIEHEYLAKINAQIIYTTNWDNLIEATYDRLNKPYTLIETANDFLKIDSSRPIIIKYHGSLRHPHTLVITESDYYERFGDDSPFDIRLKYDLIEKSLLFLGYSLRDYNVRYLWNRAQKLISQSMEKDDIPSSYFVTIRKDEIFETVLKKNNIDTINLNSSEELSNFLKYLSSSVID